MKELILSKLKDVFLQNPNSEKITVPLKNYQQEMNSFIDEQHNDFKETLNELEEEGIIIIENHVKPNLVLITLTEFGKSKL